MKKDELLLGLLDELAAAEAIISKLPKTADGVPVAPGMMVYSYQGADRTVRSFCAANLHASGLFIDGKGKRRNATLCWSTKEAAEAAKEKEDAREDAG